MVTLTGSVAGGTLWPWGHFQHEESFVGGQLAVSASCLCLYLEQSDYCIESCCSL